MRKRLVAIGIALYVIFALAAITVVIKSIPKVISLYHNPTPALRDVHVKLPTKMNERTLGVFALRPHGDPDTKYYAIGFARALSDRLSCAPTSLTQQPTADEIETVLNHLKADSRKSVQDDIAIKAGKKLGVCWIVTGDMTQTGSSSTISIKLTDMRTGKATTYTAIGTVDKLPSAQEQLAKDIISGMGISADSTQIREACTANFSQPETIRLYGLSYYASDNEQCEDYRWQAVSGDPQSLFAAIRVLTFMCNGPSTIPEIRSNKRLSKLIADTDQEYPTNSELTLLKALLLEKQERYADAQEKLVPLVKIDPDFVSAHDELAYLALCREDAQLALSESEKAVNLWPNNPLLYAWLAASSTEAERMAGSKTHSYDNESPFFSFKPHEKEANRALTAAATSVKLDPDCTTGWFEILRIASKMGRSPDSDTAFNELVRINPKNRSAYARYALCFTPQYHSSRSELDRSKSQQEKVFAKAESVFGKSSPEACYLRGVTLLNYPSDVRPNAEIISYADQGLKSGKTLTEDLLQLKGQALFGLRRYDESEAIAADGVRKWDSLSWKYLLARCYEMRYQDKHDMDALCRAESLFAKNAKEVPYDSAVFDQWGWCLSHLGKRDEAREKILKALELDPSNERARQHLKYVQ